MQPEDLPEDVPEQLVDEVDARDQDERKEKSLGSHSYELGKALGHIYGGAWLFFFCFVQLGLLEVPEGEQLPLMQEMTTFPLSELVFVSKFAAIATVLGAILSTIFALLLAKFLVWRYSHWAALGGDLDE